MTLAVGEDIAVDWRREYGAHVFELHDGHTATVLSEPTWEDFIGHFETTKTRQPIELQAGSTVVSPELITVPEPLDVIPLRSREAIDRVNRVQTLSVRYPANTFILGSPAYDSSKDNSGKAHDTRPFNAAVVLKDGIRLGVALKWMLGEGDEANVFKRIDQGPKLVGDANILVCRDLKGAVSRAVQQEGEVAARKHGFISPEATKLFISACWASSSFLIDRDGIADERWFGDPLKGYVRGIFRRYPAIRDIVIADRQPDDAHTDGPFNAHFRRTASSQE